MTNRLRSLASRVMTSWARPSASAAAGRRCGGPVDERHHRDRRRGGPPPGRVFAAPALARPAGDGRSAACGERVRLAPGLRARPREAARGRDPRPRTAGPSPPDAPRPRGCRPRRAKRVQQRLVDALVERRELAATSPDSRTPRRPGRLRRDAPAGPRGSRESGAAARSASR